MIVITKMKALRRPMLHELRRVLDLAPARKLGFVITGPISGERGAYGYRDGYSYGYGSANRPRFSEPADSEKLASLEDLGSPESVSQRERQSEKLASLEDLLTPESVSQREREDDRDG
jgi:hypothetical protein